MNYDFSKELAAYEAKKEELLRVCPGKMAVFKDDQFLGTFDNANAAYKAGIEKWGNVPFLIKPVQERESVESIPALCLGFIHARL